GNLLEGCLYRAISEGKYGLVRKGAATFTRSARPAKGARKSTQAGFGADAARHRCQNPGKKKGHEQRGHLPPRSIRRNQKRDQPYRRDEYSHDLVSSCDVQSYVAQGRELLAVPSAGLPRAFSGGGPKDHQDPRQGSLYGVP